jgi:hypothetical protein
MSKQTKNKTGNKSSSEHSPTLKTILMVEKVLKDNNDKVLKVSELKRLLPKQVNHNTLMMVVDYLDRSNKIAFNFKGMMWIANNNPKLREAIRKATDYDDIVAEKRK